MITLGQYRRGPEDLTWSATFILPDGKKKVLSLGQVTEIQATIASAKLYAAGLSGRRKDEVAKKAPTFRDAAMIAADKLERLYRDTLKAEGTSKAAKYSALRSKIMGPLMAGLGDVEWVDIMQEADRWLDGYRLGDGGIPAKGTIGNINAALQKVCDVAVRQGWLPRGPEHRPKLSKKDFREGRREPTFTADEMARIERHMSDRWVSDSTPRHLTRVLVALLSTTGLRPGIETNALLESQIHITEDGIMIDVLANQGKYKTHRQAICRENDVFDIRSILVDHLAWRKSKWKANTHYDSCSLFANPVTGRVPQIDDEFKAMLVECKLLIDPLTRLPRVCYSLRHYFFTESLKQGIPEHDLIQCGGTSSMMLKKHYSHVKGSDVIKRMANRPAVSDVTLERFGLTPRGVLRVSNDAEAMQQVADILTPAMEADYQRLEREYLEELEEGQGPAPTKKL